MTAVANSRVSLHDQVTNRIVSQLEQGRFPWVQPWASSGAPLGLPQNVSTGRTYSGVNILLLWAAAIEQGRTSQKWLTFKQALDLGGHVRKGETGTMIVYADTFVPKSERVKAAETGGQPVGAGFLKRFTVFNVEQCENLGGAFPEPAVLPGKSDPIPQVEAVIASAGADIRIGGDMAFYAPGPDFIQIPPQEAYFEPINWYRTKLHELGHWTGHASRLNRHFPGRRGGEAYAREELVAELASAFLCAELGIAPTVRHADYLGAWLDVLKADNRAIFQAASFASKAADFVMGRSAIASLGSPNPT
jgi:antirestriction protein ArdC